MFIFAAASASVTSAHSSLLIRPRPRALNFIDKNPHFLKEVVKIRGEGRIGNALSFASGAFCESPGHI